MCLFHEDMADMSIELLLCRGSSSEMFAVCASNQIGATKIKLYHDICKYGLFEWGSCRMHESIIYISKLSNRHSYFPVFSRHNASTLYFYRPTVRIEATNWLSDSLHNSHNSSLRFLFHQLLLICCLTTLAQVETPLPLWQWPLEQEWMSQNYLQPKQKISSWVFSSSMLNL